MQPVVVFLLPFAFVIPVLRFKVREVLAVNYATFSAAIERMFVGASKVDVVDVVDVLDVR